MAVGYHLLLFHSKLIINFKSRQVKTKTALLILTVVIAGSITACKKDSQINPNSPSTLNLKMQGLNRNVSLPVTESGIKSTSVTTASVVWDSARIIVSKVSFQAEMRSTLTREDSIEIEYSWKGPQTINLFDLSATIGSIVLPAGTYEKVSLKVNSEKMDANGHPLFYLSGKYTNAAGTIIPLVISVTDPISFKAVQKEDSIVSGSAIDFTSTIQLYLDQILLKVDPASLDNAALSNGILEISATYNSQLYWQILQNLRRDHHCESEHHHHND
jgi:hypothetical protein